MLMSTGYNLKSTNTFAISPRISEIGKNGQLKKKAKKIGKRKKQKEGLSSEKKEKTKTKKERKTGARIQNIEGEAYQGKAVICSANSNN